MQRIKKKIIMDENDALSEFNKIPLGHNHNLPMAPFTPKSTSKSLHIGYSIIIPRSIPRANTTYCSIIINIITTVFLTLLTTTAMFIVLTLYVNE